MKHTRLLKWMLVAFMALCTVFAFTACDDGSDGGDGSGAGSGWTSGLLLKNFTFEEYEGGYEITEYHGKAKNLTLPAEYKGKPVVSIKGWAFLYDNDLKSITIPEGITHIEEGLTVNCNDLLSLTVAMGNPVYHSSQNCIIETKTKTLIAGCGTSIIPTDGSVSSIGMYAFYGANLTSITIPDSVISIEKYAFEYTDLESIEISQSVSKICEGAFSHTDLENIKIPQSVTLIEKEVFVGCDMLTAICVEKGNTIYHSEGNCIIENDSKMLIAGCNTSVIPNDGSVTVIGESAFRECNFLYEINIPNSVTMLGDFAFAENTFAYNSYGFIKQFILPNSLKSIGSACFQGSAIINLTVPKRVTSIGEGAFMFSAGPRYGDWRGVVYLNVEEGNPVYHSAGNCIIETKSKTLIGAGYQAIIPDDGSVNIIGVSAFSCHSELMEISIPNSVTEIREFAFICCLNISNFIIPNNVVTIGNYAFA